MASVPLSVGRSQRAAFSDYQVSDRDGPLSAQTLTEPGQKAVMEQAIPRQHPAVVRRSRYTLVRALLAAATIAVVALTVAVVMLANDGNEGSGTSSAKPIQSLNYGGFNPTTGRPESAPLPR